MNRHDYDREKCIDFFQAYRDCKKAWVRHLFSCLVSKKGILYEELMIRSVVLVLGA